MNLNRARIVTVLSAILLAFGGLVATTAPAQASSQACDLRVAKNVNYSALMLYVGTGLDGCSTSVTEVLVELQFAPAAAGPYVTTAQNYAYSGGAAWFEEADGRGCGYYIGVARWQDQVETTPDPVYACFG
ncbi:hypothetical protein [Kribbella deserti]|uniref:Spore-associated protein A n=1 Tax=Kribbella deserti TaxID=1926257 RepID=A0ABV6QDA0_9ACTN